MDYQFPPDVARLVKEQMANGHFGSEDEVLRHALQAFSELRSREEELLADVRTGLDQADLGLAQPLDVSALIDRCALRLAQKGIRD
jgi:Arc/MetJ-type ribon-helix-helix transcriptional regulator